MTETISTTRVRMANKTDKPLTKSDFKIETLQLPSLEEGEVLCQTRFISLDPYLVGMMQSWQGPQRDWSNGIIVGRKVAQIIDSRDSNFNKGDWVAGDSRWQDIEVDKGKHLQKLVIDDAISPSHYLGALGSSGITAWVGINRVLPIEANKVMSISSAAGIVANIAGQLAMRKNAKVIGIAGGKTKCKQVVEDIGFDACVDHQGADLELRLADTAQQFGGIDLHFENVGAKTLDPVLNAMNELGHIALCGLIAHYQDTSPITLKHFRKLLTAGITLQPFRVYDYPQDFIPAQQELMAGLKEGWLTVKETITDGIENAPEAYINMLNGGGTGKHLIRIV